MRAAVLLLTLAAVGCEFVVPPSVDIPVGPGTGGSGATTPPPSSATPPPAGAADAGVTTPPANVDMGQAPIGSPCTSNAECGYGLICGKSFFEGQQIIQLPGGYCTMDCKSAPCPANSVCTTFPFGQYCSSSCPPDPCRTSQGYQCCDPDNNGSRTCNPTALCPRKGPGPG